MYVHVYTSCVQACATPQVIKPQVIVRFTHPDEIDLHKH